MVANDDVDKATTLVRLLRKHYPDARVLARARDRRHAWQLLDLGVKPFRELFGSSLEMGREVLVALGMEARQATEYASRFREFDERVLDAQRLMQDDEDALLQSARNARRELEELFEADAGEGTLGRIVERKD